MPERPMAYHITFGTYGTRLHGDDRGTVDRRMNQPGDPIVGRDMAWQRMEAAALRFPPIVLTRQQRTFAEATLPAVCQRGGWPLTIAAVQPDHVHILLTSDQAGAAVRRWLKTWLGQTLSERWSLPAGASWWAEGGSVKWVWDEGYFENIRNYITEQRTA